MRQFMMIFRNDYNQEEKPSPQEIQENIQRWQDWIGGIAAQDCFVSTERLGFEGKTLQSDGLVTDGPYVEMKEIVGGYIIVKAADIKTALKMAEDCPILAVGGTVEIRDIMPIPN